MVGRRACYRMIEAGCDVACWIVGLIAAGWLTVDLGRPYPGPYPGPYLAARAVLAVGVLSVGTGLIAGLYRGRYQRGSLDEAISVARAGFGQVLVLLVLGRAILPGQLLPVRTVLGGALVALLTMSGARYLVAAARLSSKPRKSAGVKVIVFGAGHAGAALIHGLARQPAAPYRPVALLDDDPAKRRLRIGGVPVLGDRTQMAEAAARTGAKIMVIAIARASGSAIRDLTSEADRCGLIPKVIPSVAELLSGSARIDSVRDPRITDLLGRTPVETDIARIAGHFAGKRVLVTGAGGSIGSELCRQLYRFQPEELIMLDRDESALHAIQLKLHGRALLDSDDLVLADIRDQNRIREAFTRCQPQIVFHAAALKHLPLLERYPAEALKSNVWGSFNVLEAAAAVGVESFVNISTDKAADPVSVLGYSKRIAERLTAEMASRTGRGYLSVRFGNVLGSRGSVLTAFSAQVASGGPITVTDPEAARYFMTAGEAVELVLQAAVIGRGGEVMVLDMGEQVRIADIARRLAATVADPVEIVYTGLRPGEKLVEDLLGSEEVDDRPRHPLIRQVPVPALSPRLVLGIDPDAPDDQLKALLAAGAGVAGRGADGPELGRLVGANPSGLLVETLSVPRQQRPGVRADGRSARPLPAARPAGPDQRAGQAAKFQCRRVVRAGWSAGRVCDVVSGGFT